MAIIIVRNDIKKIPCDAVVEFSAGRQATISEASGVHAKCFINVNSGNIGLSTKTALDLAKERKIYSIAFPGMDEERTRAMVEEMRKYPELNILLVSNDDTVEETIYRVVGQKEHLSAVAVLKHGDKILIMERSELVGGYQKQYYFPAGRLEEFGLLDTAIQEVEEEAGIPKDKIRLVGGPWENSNQKYGVKFTRHIFLFECDTDEVKLNWENSDAQWVLPQDVEKFRCVPFLKDDLRLTGLL